MTWTDNGYLIYWGSEVTIPEAYFEIAKKLKLVLIRCTMSTKVSYWGSFISCNSF